MSEPTREPQVIRDMRADVRQFSVSANDEEMWGAFTLGQEREVIAYLDALVAELDAAVRQMHEWENAAGVYEAGMVRAERERDAAVQKARYESDVAAQAVEAMDAAVRDAQIVREIRGRQNVVVEVSPELLTNGVFTDQPLHVMLTDNGDGTHLLTFRESDELDVLRTRLAVTEDERDAAVQSLTDARATAYGLRTKLAAAESERDAAVQQARYESDVAAQAVEAMDAAVRERDDLIAFINKRDEVVMRCPECDNRKSHGHCVGELRAKLAAAEARLSACERVMDAAKRLADHSIADFEAHTVRPGDIDDVIYAVDDYRATRTLPAPGTTERRFHTGAQVFKHYGATGTTEGANDAEA